MATALEMPRVQSCTVTSCSYNQDGCHAFAISVGGEDGHAQCSTFVEMPTRGGIESMIALVGACQRSDCRHNAELECHAPAIVVSPEQAMADCMTYDPS
ncbi:DUF1540 domain-containing protein [Micromonospora sonneratiae]|uniref:DUF1540 domain-containing protein n=1 Tax=Micromonospora sonneratiae TaxID=1184706 RepID=A0ABW3YK00_9ACTN